MKETYTLKEAMERLGIKTANTFFQMERKYPEAFVVVKKKGMGYHNRRNIHYDKATLDRFADSRDNFKKEHR